MKKKIFSLLLGFLLTISFVAIVSAEPSKEYPLGKAVIKVGGQDISSGMNADYGLQMKWGAQMAIDEINAAGGILNSKLEMKWMDSQLSAKLIVENAKYMVEQWGADFLFGLSLDGGIKALAPHLPKWKVLFMGCHAASPTINEELVFGKKPGGDHIFRIVVPFYQDAMGAIYFSKWPDIKSWSILVADYEYGWVVKELFQNNMAKRRPDVKFLNEASAPYGTTDFSGQIAALMAKKPNMIVSVPWAGEGVSAIRQAQMAGLFEQPWFKVWYQCMGGSVDLAEGIIDDVKAGKFHGKLWATARYLWNQSDRPENKKFVAEFRKRHDGRYPNYSAAATYTTIYAFKKALEKTRSLDDKALIKAMEGMTIDGPEGERWIRPEDHNACYTVPLGRYTYDSSIADIPFLTNFSHIPWQDYFRNPPDYKTP